MEVYDFATRECFDRPGNKPPSKIGDESFIIHPDHPGDRHGTGPDGVDHDGLRDSHQDHIHFQIGAT